MPNTINSNKMHKIILVVEKQGTNEALVYGERVNCLLSNMTG